MTRIVCKSSIHVEDYESFLTADDLPAGDVAWLRDSTRGNQTYKAGMWRAGVSECPYYFAADETFVMIEGVLRISLDDGQAFEFGPGDTGSFELGTHSLAGYRTGAAFLYPDNLTRRHRRWIFEVAVDGQRLPQSNSAGPEGKMS